MPGGWRARGPRPWPALILTKAPLPRYALPPRPAETATEVKAKVEAHAAPATKEQVFDCA